MSDDDDAGQMAVDVPPPPDPTPQHGFDLDAYIACYTGHTRIDRLLFIAKVSKGQPLELEALKLAHDDLKKVGRG